MANPRTDQTDAEATPTTGTPTPAPPRAVNALPHEFDDPADLDALGNSTFASRRKARVNRGRAKRIVDPERNKRIEEAATKDRPRQPKARQN